MDNSLHLKNKSQTQDYIPYDSVYINFKNAKLVYGCTGRIMDALT